MGRCCLLREKSRKFLADSHNGKSEIIVRVAREIDGFG